MSAGVTDIVVAKFDAQGNHVWSKRFGDFSYDRPTGIATDASGNIVLTGDFQSTVDFGICPLVSDDNQADIYFAKFCL